MEKVMKDIFLKLMFNILKKLCKLHNSLTFLPQQMKIENVEKVVANQHYKTEYVLYIRNLKQALNQGLEKIAQNC